MGVQLSFKLKKKKLSPPPLLLTAEIIDQENLTFLSISLCDYFAVGIPKSNKR
jgi:hypothetical protein